MKPPSRSTTVVIIEEDPSVRAATEAVLARSGFRVRATGDPAEGVDYVDGDRAQVVIVGFGTGWQTLDLVRRLSGRFEPIPLPVRPRIVIAARELDAATERFARKLGADAILRLPVAGQDLIATVDELMRREAVRALFEEVNARHRPGEASRNVGLRQ